MEEDLVPFLDEGLDRRFRIGLTLLLHVDILQVSLFLFNVVVIAFLNIIQKLILTKGLGLRSCLLVDVLVI